MDTSLQGAAKRMEGMTPSGIVALLKYARRTRGQVQADDMAPIIAMGL
jgi:hypothetical protein